MLGCTCLAVLLAGCPEPPPPEQHTLELAGRGTLVVDTEMVDTWEKVYRSTFTYRPPPDGGPPEPVVEVSGRALPLRLVGVEDEQLDVVPMRLATIAILTRDLIILRLPQTRAGSDSLMVRAGPGEWHRYDFDERSYAGQPLWEADRRPHDEAHGGFSEAAQLDLRALELTFHHHAGYLIREIRFRLAPDGRSIELVGLRRAPLETRHRGDFDPDWSSAVLLARAREIFAGVHDALDRGEPGSAAAHASEAFLADPGALRRLGEAFERDDDGRVALDDARIVELYACPADGPPDRLRVLFGIRGAGAKRDDGEGAAPWAGYRSELWRLRRVEDVWRVDAVELNDPHAAAILELTHATFDEVRSCRKVY